MKGMYLSSSMMSCLPEGWPGSVVFPVTSHDKLKHISIFGKALK